MSETGKSNEIEAKENEDNENKSPNQNSSKESLKGIRNSKKDGFVSRLFQPTASSAAKSSKPSNVQPLSRNTTPVLQRKLLNRANTTPVGKPPILSAGKPARSEVKSQLGQPRSGGVKKFVGVATSSFINQDKVDTPTDWDASAIIPIDEQHSVRNTVVLNFDPAKLIRVKHGSSSSDKFPHRGPLRAFSADLQTNVSDGSGHRSLEAQRLLRKIPNSSIGDGNCDDSIDAGVEQIYDEYIMSELIKMNAKRCFKNVSDKIDVEVSSAWISLEEARTEYLQLLELSQKMAKLKELSEQLDTDIQELSLASTIKSQQIENSNQLAQALLQSRHYLKVVGLNATSSAQSSNILQKVITEKSPTFNASTLQDESSAIQKLESEFSEVVSLFNECSDLTQKVAKLQIESDSLQLSMNQSEVKLGSNLLNLRNALKAPQRPLVKLIDF